MNNSTGPVVPAYFHPALAPTDWTTLARVAPQLGLVVLNVANGPGDVPDHAFVDVVRNAQAAGAPFAGYVDTDYGRKSTEEVLRELHRYGEWYGVGNVFLDRSASGVEHVGRYRHIATHCRAFGADIVAFNHGTHPAQEYAEHADLLGTFEGALPAYLDLDVPRWVHDLPAGSFFHLLYSTPAEVAGAVNALAAERNAGALYRTERTPPNPWAGLPADFPRAPSPTIGWPR
ncbi:MAG TPA: spherulation-specific family 4 protein [Pseudonocardiaceae bacterium]|jgi:hypothetical protein|nr:spherulation-specific family 4 protein [Pseudonocardiaceae bacterium]